MLSLQNIESELSYAYLHAVASRAGFGCKIGSRHDDGAGVDAILSEDGRRLDPSAPNSLASFEVDVQLKATYRSPVERDGRYSYSLDVGQYNKLRETARLKPLFLVVLFLPETPEDWLVHSERALVAKRCAYWVSLRGAASANQSNQTVHLPRDQVLSVESLTALMTRVSRWEFFK